MAATHNCVEIARMLIEAGTQLRCKDNEELTPLHCAAMEGNIEIVQLLFQAGAKQDGWVTISNVSMADYLVSSLNHMYSKKNLPGLKDNLLTLYYVSFAWWYCLLLVCNLLWVWCRWWTLLMFCILIGFRWSLTGTVIRTPVCTWRWRTDITTWSNSVWTSGLTSTPPAVTTCTPYTWPLKQATSGIVTQALYGRIISRYNFSTEREINPSIIEPEK